MKKFIKIFVGTSLALLPWHALVVTAVQCRFGYDVSFFRFWKEIIVVFGFLVTLVLFFRTWTCRNKREKWLFYFIGLFFVSSGVFTFYPSFGLQQYELLGLKYDVFLFFAFLIGYVCFPQKEMLAFAIKVLAWSTGIMLLVFLPWYIFGDIASMQHIFGYSGDVSTYVADRCLTFAQSAPGHYRLQAAFGGPIRMSVFLVVLLAFFSGNFFSGGAKRIHEIIFGGTFIFFALLAVFFSYSKTAMLGIICLIGVFLFSLFGKGATKVFSRSKFMIIGGIGVVILGFFISHMELFIHPRAIQARLDFLADSWEQFKHYPFGSGIGMAGPVTMLDPIFQGIKPLLPENWLFQIFIEQGIIGGVIFLVSMIMIFWMLFVEYRFRPTSLTLGFLAGFVSLMVMSMTTHTFEEAATAYGLMFIIGSYLGYSQKVGK